MRRKISASILAIALLATTACGTNWIPIVVNALGIVQAAVIADTTLPTADQAAIVKFCTSATATVNAAASGWQSAVSTGLTQLKASLSAATQVKYAALFAGLQLLLVAAS
jgi:hypothetical protein